MVRGRVELTATSHVRADIDAATVAIAEGCMFDGRVHMGGGEAQPLAASTVTFREKRKRKGSRADLQERHAAAAALAAGAPPAEAVAAPPAEVAVTPPVDVAEKPVAELAVAPAESVAAEAIPPASDFLPSRPPPLRPRERLGARRVLPARAAFASKIGPSAMRSLQGTLWFPWEGLAGA